MRFFQVTLENNPSDTASDVLQANQDLNVIDLAFKGGWVMIPILVLSLIAVYLIVERYLAIKRAGNYDAKFMGQIKSMVLNGNIKGALNHCQTTETPIARMLGKGLTRIGKPLKDIHVAVQNVGRLEVQKLEKGLPVLATIAGVAPMIGFFGTVIGMIKTFHSLSQSADTINAGALSGGIYVAMVTTVAGLVVGIIAYLGYNLLTSKLDKVVYHMEASSLEFIDILHEPAE